MLVGPRCGRPGRRRTPVPYGDPGGVRGQPGRPERAPPAPTHRPTPARPHSGTELVLWLPADGPVGFIPFQSAPVSEYRKGPHWD